MKCIILIFALFLISCNGSSKQESEKETTSAKSQKKSCLTEMTDPTTWLPLTSAAEILKLPEEQIEQKAYKTISCNYNWKSDRKYNMEVGKNKIEINARNFISISIKNLDIEIEKWLGRSYVKQKEMSYAEYFDKFNGAPMTKEDKAEVNKQIDKKAEKDEDFDKQKAELAKNIVALSKTENFTELTDLGDKANYYIQLAPNLRELRLAVLSGNVVLNITVDASDNDAEDLSIAKAVAQAIMARCK